MKKCLFFLIFCYMFFPFPASSQNNKFVHIEVMGSTAVSLYTLKPDDIALEDGFRKAVTMVVETILTNVDVNSDSIILILDDKIYSNASRYISNYRIISEETMEDDLPITEGGVAIRNIFIEADIAIELLTADLVKTGIINEEGSSGIAVTMLNLRNYNVFEHFKKELQEASGVKEVHYNSFNRDRIELIVEMIGVAETLKERIAAIDIQGWKIDFLHTSTDRIAIVFSPIIEESRPQKVTQ